MLRPRFARPVRAIARFPRAYAKAVGETTDTVSPWGISAALVQQYLQARYSHPNRIDRTGDWITRYNKKQRSTVPRNKYVEDTPEYRASFKRKAQQSKLPFKQKKPPRKAGPTNPAPPQRRVTPGIATGEASMDIGTSRKRKYKGNMSMPYVPGGRFKRPRRKVTVPMHKYHYEDHGVVTRSNVAYVGVNAMGGRARLLRPVAASILAKLLKRMQVTVSNHDAAVSWIDMDSVVPYALRLGLSYQEEDGTAVTLRSTVVNLVASQTFNTLVDSLTSKLVSTFTVNPDYSYTIAFLEVSDADHTDVKGSITDLENMLIRVSCIQRVDVQNQSTSDSDNKDKHQIDNNPLKGKRYHFKSPFPKIRDNLNHIANPFQDVTGAFEQGMLNTGIDADAIYSTTPTETVFNPFFAPPNGVSIWKNCVSQSSLAMKPGEHKHFSTKYQFSGYLKTFMRQVKDFHARSTPTTYVEERNRLGHSVLLGFEPSIRTGDETITLAIQKEQHVSASVKYAKKPSLPMKHIIGGNLSV